MFMILGLENYKKINSKRIYFNIFKENLKYLILSGEKLS